AMRVIAPRANDALIGRLDENLAGQKLALDRADAVGFSQLDLAFHDILLSELGFDRVRHVLEAARASLTRTRMFLLRTPERQAETHDEHLAIVDALRTGDPQAAWRAMAAHLDRTLDEIETGAAQNPEVFALTSGSPRT